MGDVVDLFGKGYTADETLDLFKGKLESALVIGIDQDGQLSVCASEFMEDPAEAVFALERIKHAIILGGFGFSPDD